MSRMNRLELTWIGKNQRTRLEPRILVADEALSYHAPNRETERDQFENLIIQADNLLALEALKAEYAGKVKCIYIDPPYNTGNAFEHYDDGQEHSIWLTLMRDRISILRDLLDDGGFICAHIDDSEGHYLKVLLDEIFGRENYLTTLYVQVRYPQKTLKQDMAFHKQIEMIHVYRKAYGAKPNLNSVSKGLDKYIYRVEEKSAGEQILLGGKSVTIFRKDEYDITKIDPSEDGLKEIWATGSILDGNSSGRFFRDHLTGRADHDGLGCLYKVSGIGDDRLSYRYFTGPKREGATKGKYFQGVPLRKNSEFARDETSPIENFYDLAGSFGNCRHEGGVEFRSGKKPEKLLEIILTHFSSPGDLVLDSFAGSGTTGAVAHKMGRRWIMIELGNHALSHVVQRMRRVIDGEDLSGVTQSTGWGGGGGFRFCRLAPSLLEKDRFGNWVISRNYNAAMLAEALCKHLGFTYAPSADLADYWRHGHSTETDFIFVTTQSLTYDALKKLSEEVGPKRSLLVCCKAFNAKEDSFPNLTVKKIPHSILAKCEWGRDDYSLRVASLPEAELTDAPGASPVPAAPAREKASATTLPLFRVEEDEQ